MRIGLEILSADGTWTIPPPKKNFILRGYMISWHLGLMLFPIQQKAEWFSPICEVLGQGSLMIQRFYQLQRWDKGLQELNYSSSSCKNSSGFHGGEVLGLCDTEETPFFLQPSCNSMQLSLTAGVFGSWWCIFLVIFFPDFLIKIANCGILCF